MCCVVKKVALSLSLFWALFAPAISKAQDAIDAPDQSAHIYPPVPEVQVVIINDPTLRAVAVDDPVGDGAYLNVNWPSTPPEIGSAFFVDVECELFEGNLRNCTSITNEYAEYHNPSIDTIIQNVSVFSNSYTSTKPLFEDSIIFRVYWESKKSQCEFIDNIINNNNIRCLFFRTNNIKRFYPERGYENDVEGIAEIQCNIINEKADFSCVTISETPKGYGFGYLSSKNLIKFLKLENTNKNIQITGTSFNIVFKYNRGYK